MNFLQKQTFSKILLRAFALAGLIASTSVLGNSFIDSHSGGKAMPNDGNDLASANKDRMQPSPLWADLAVGVYDTGINTAKGAMTCKLSVLEIDGAKVPVLTDCTAPRQTLVAVKPFVAKIDLPKGLFNRAAGQYEVDITSVRGKESCVATVLPHRNVVLGSCRPQ